jgi:hypothetical protein
MVAGENGKKNGPIENGLIQWFLRVSITYMASAPASLSMLSPSSFLLQ